MDYASANPLQRGLRRFSSSRPGSWLFRRVLHHVDRPVFRLSGRRFTLTSALAGMPMAMVTTTGAKSGKPRTVPVMGLPTDDGLVVISSSFGQERQPGWYHNLRADPNGHVSVKGEGWDFRAVEAQGEQRARVWEQALKTYPGFATYEKRASHRRIGVWILEPRP